MKESKRRWKRRTMVFGWDLSNRPGVDSYARLKQLSDDELLEFRLTLAREESDTDTWIWGYLSAQFALIAIVTSGHLALQESDPTYGQSLAGLMIGLTVAGVFLFGGFVLHLRVPVVELGMWRELANVESERRLEAPASRTSRMRRGTERTRKW